MPILYSSITSGSTTSGQLVLERTDRDMGVMINSYAPGSELRIAFAPASGGPWYPLYKPDGSGSPFSVTSGVGPAACRVNGPLPSRYVQFVSVLTLSTTTSIQVTAGLLQS